MAKARTWAYGKPRKVKSLDKCNFYHTVDIPGYGLVSGQWDLRKDPEKFIGGLDIKGKRVLEIGTADGFLAFDMERRGAQVVGYDLGPDKEYDFVPFGGSVTKDHRTYIHEYIDKLNNSWWLLHDALGSKARVVYGSVYDVPEDLGPFDVATISCVLLHLRDPFLAMQRVGRVTEDAFVVTEVLPGFSQYPHVETTRRRPLLVRGLNRVARRFGYTFAQPAPTGDYTFLPAANNPDQWWTWWHLSPAVVRNYMGILGFPNIEVSFHDQYYEVEKRMISLYTVVGRRARK